MHYSILHVVRFIGQKGMSHEKARPIYERARAVLNDKDEFVGARIEHIFGNAELAAEFRSVALSQPYHEHLRRVKRLLAEAA